MQLPDPPIDCVASQHSHRGLAGAVNVTRIEIEIHLVDVWLAVAGTH